MLPLAYKGISQVPQVAFSLLALPALMMPWLPVLCRMQADSSPLCLLVSIASSAPWNVHSHGENQAKK